MIKSTLSKLFKDAKKTITQHITIQNCLIVIVLFAFSLIVTVSLSPGGLRRNSSWWIDTWVFQTVGYVMQKGGMPYLDSFDHKGPLLFIINYLGLNINPNVGLWIIELLFLFGTFLALYKIARLFCRKITSIVCVALAIIPLFAFFDGGNMTEEYAMLFIATALYIFLDFFINHKISRLRWIVCGVCFACVCMLRPNMIAVWIVFCAVAFFSLISHKKWQIFRQFMFYFIGGFLIVTLPIILWLGIRGALVPCFEQYILFNFQYSSNTTRGATNENRWNMLFYFCQSSIIVITLLISGWLCIQKDKRTRAIGLIYSAYLSLSLLLIVLPGQDYAHYAMVLIPAIIFPMSYVIGKIERHINASNYYLASAIGIYILATLAAPTWLTNVKNAGIYYKHRHDSQINTSVQQVIDYVIKTTPENSKISAYGNGGMDIFYILTHRLPASKYSYQAPIGDIKPEIIDEYFVDISKTQPAAIIIREYENGNYRLETQRMKDFLSQNNYTCDFKVNYGKDKLIVCEK